MRAGGDRGVRGHDQRAGRPAFSAEGAAAELRRLVSQGVLEPRATNAEPLTQGAPHHCAATSPEARLDF